MHYAVWAASSPMIKILLLYNVDINLQDEVCTKLSSHLIYSLLMHYLLRNAFSFAVWLDTTSPCCSVPENRYSEAFVIKGS